MAELGNIDKKNNCISHFVDRQARNDQLEYPFSSLSKLLDFVFQVPIISAPPFILAFWS